MAEPRETLDRMTMAPTSSFDPEPVTQLFIIEDSALVVERLIDMIQEIETVEVVGQTGMAGEAIRTVVELQPDAVILDLNLDEGTGFQVLKTLKQLQTPPTVIVLTNYPLPQYRERCLSLGADFFFDKSIEFEEAVQVLRYLSGDADS